MILAVLGFQVEGPSLARFSRVKYVVNSVLDFGCDFLFWARRI